ncbi:MAG: glutamate--tRNA ligase, partial [Thermoleophilia bacterium]|nr:glutamate--tRNA ligase [Thermoleophilia bacterium]
PTGELHLGSAMTALANAAIARHGGVLVLRIDDTDRERSTPESVDRLLDMLGWLGVTYDEGPHFQATRDDAHQQLLDWLIVHGNAYPCFCTPERLEEVRQAQISAGKPARYDNHCRHMEDGEVTSRLNRNERPAYRLRVPAERDYNVVDLVHGDVAGPAGSFGDFVLQRANGGFTYLFASVCDDIAFAISHVVRGEDHLPNTPRQLAIFDALDVAPPRFAHLPLLRSDSGRKLSKRDPLGTLDELRNRGVLPSTVRRYLAELLGQGSVDLLIDDVRFDIGKVPRSAPHVDETRIASVGREDIASLPEPTLVTLVAARGVQINVRERSLLIALADGAATVDDIVDGLRHVRAVPPPEVSVARDEREAAIVRYSAGLAREYSGEDRANLETVSGSTVYVTELRLLASSLTLEKPGVGRVLKAVRRALTGVGHGPPLPAVVEALGTTTVIERLTAATPVPQSGRPPA